MTKLTKSEIADRDAHLSWRKWGEQFDWTLYGSNGRFGASFCNANGVMVEVSLEVREAFDERLKNEMRASEISAGIAATHN